MLVLPLHVKVRSQHFNLKDTYTHSAVVGAVFHNTFHCSFDFFRLAKKRLKNEKMR